MRISDWSSDVCSSDLGRAGVGADCFLRAHAATPRAFSRSRRGCAYTTCPCSRAKPTRVSADDSASAIASAVGAEIAASTVIPACARSEEHTSELQSLMRISSDVFCLKKKKKQQPTERKKGT